LKRRVLFVAAEHDGLVKVGGLADVAAGLPRALAALGHDVRVLLPCYGSIARDALREADAVAELDALGGRLRLRRGGAGEPPVYLADLPMFRRRRAGPYEDAAHRPYGDDAQAFDALARVAALIAGDRLGLRWRPDVVHANEWHAGLVPVRLMLERVPAATVFTIHNLAYRGLFPASAWPTLGLPEWLFHPEALEFHGQVCLIKGGLNFADRLTTVSPGYAAEVLTPRFGEGLDGVLRRRRAALRGIVNGVDPAAWDPARDAALPEPYSARRPAGKRAARAALAARFGMAPPAEGELVLAFVGRLVAQKGIDLILAALPDLLEGARRLVVLGSGEPALERALRAAAARSGGRLAVAIGQDDALARLAFAGADALLMPSRFEPCGLTQLYALRYGTLPIAHAVGGLRDTIVDSADEAAASDGFLFAAPTAADLLAAVGRAARVHADREAWRRRMLAGMRRDHGWRAPAAAYAALYEEALAARR
jgi:starch synthase